MCCPVYQAFRPFLLVPWQSTRMLAEDALCVVLVPPPDSRSRVCVVNVMHGVPLTNRPCNHVCASPALTVCAGKISGISTKLARTGTAFIQDV